MTNELKNKIENCTTEKQLKAVLKKSKLKITGDDTEEVGCFSIWVGENTRIYKPCRSKRFIVQKWTKTRFQYSGIPVFFENDSYF